MQGGAAGRRHAALLRSNEPVPIVREREFEFRDRDFATIARLVKDQTGIALSERKRDLVYGRLARRLRVLGIADFAEYCDILSSPAGEAERLMMINAITTNLTGFFREGHHFQFLSDEVLPGLAAAWSPTNRRMRIWSAGCSSGEEPYSIAMAVQAGLAQAGRGGVDRWDLKILATDIDTEMIAWAKQGRYDRRRAEAIPAHLRKKHVEAVDDDTVEMSDALKSLIVFNPLNLLEPWPMRGPFDVIFCRNVVIYFDKPTQRVLFDRFADMLTAQGWLFIGHSESLFNVSDRFRLVGRTIYRRVS
jgi:chemotaxis protein methyltransferase CheR